MITNSIGTILYSLLNGKKVGEDDRIKVISEGNSRKLVIDKVIDKDEGEYEFRIRFFFLNV